LQLSCHAFLIDFYYQPAKPLHLFAVVVAGGHAGGHAGGQVVNSSQHRASGASVQRGAVRSH